MPELKTPIKTRYLNKLKRINKRGGDPEQDHSDADWVLCEMLRELGFEDVVQEYQKVDKWYA